MTPLVPVPKPSYSKARENLVKAIPSKIICLLACGGRDCRYEDPTCWRPSQQCIKGLFSSWVTKDIVAMARPSTYLIKKYNIIEQFNNLNIKSIINMQLPGEHAQCGPELEPDSGFTYSPQVFMENQIYFYNFGMTDFGVSSMVGMLDAVKVLAFSVQEGKVAVHCHAGLGRTGVLIACYLVYTLRISANEAVHYVRIKRPRSIQTRAQINMVFDFARLMGSQLVHYPSLSMRHGAPFSLRQYLQRQALLLHGEEARFLTHTPKILHLLCSILAALAEDTINPPEAQMELERKSAILALWHTVRDTLVRQRYLPVQREGEGSYESLSTWDEPLGFLERKRVVLLNKRSYSESDLCKLTKNKCYTTFMLDGTVRNGFISYLQEQRSMITACDDMSINKSHRAFDIYTQIKSSRPHLCNISSHKTAKRRLKKSQVYPQYSSSTELHKYHRSGKICSSVEVAKAMAQQEPPGDKILQRVVLLQNELNFSAYGWATLAMETDPKVLSALLWIWLEKLKEPVLISDDIDKLSTSIADQNPLKTLHKSKRSTLYCLLSCVGQVTTHCPQLQNAILQQLVRALIRRPLEDITGYSALLQVLIAAVRELQRLTRFRPETPTTKSSEKSS